MKSLGVILIGIGIILSIVKVVSPGISWAVIIVGIVLLLAGYLFKSKAS